MNFRLFNLLDSGPKLYPTEINWHLEMQCIIAMHCLLCKKFGNLIVEASWAIFDIYNQSVFKEVLDRIMTMIVT